jgi:transcriptional regulator with XRE-family HTH domain
VEHLTLPWSDKDFRERITARAEELGMTVSTLLENAGVSRETYYKVPTTGRRIDTIEKIAGACHWTLAEAMGIDERPKVEDMGLAHARAERVMAGLPKWARTPERFVEAQTYLYEEVLTIRREFRERGASATAEDLKAIFEQRLAVCERALVRSLAPKDLSPAPGSTEPPRR